MFWWHFINKNIIIYFNTCIYHGMSFQLNGICHYYILKVHALFFILNSFFVIYVSRSEDIIWNIFLPFNIGYKGMFKGKDLIWVCIISLVYHIVMK